MDNTRPLIPEKKINLILIKNKILPFLVPLNFPLTNSDIGQTQIAYSLKIIKDKIKWWKLFLKQILIH